MRRLILLCGVCVLCTACGSSPSAPSTTTTTIPGPATITLTGHVTATNGGQPLAGVQAVLGASSSTTDGAGQFRAQLPPGGSLRLALTGSGIVPRALTVATGTTRDVDVSAIGLSGGFDLGFYRQLVRNTIDTPGGLEPLRRWTAAPNVYLRTVRDDGTPIDGAMLNTVETVIRDAMPRWSGFGPASVLRGSDTQAGRAGWVTVTWPGVVGADRVCGRANVAVSGGTLDLYVPTASACGCDGSARIRPRMIRHELGHVMGFWHTDSPSDVMHGTSGACDTPISPRELGAAAIAYTRPIGNVDPDSDPVSAVALSPMTVR